MIELFTRYFYKFCYDIYFPRSNILYMRLMVVQNAKFFPYKAKMYRISLERLQLLRITWMCMFNSNVAISLSERVINFRKLRLHRFAILVNVFLIVHL